MTVKELRAILKNAPADMGIVIWNGLVDDYTPITNEVTTILKYKYSYEFLLASLTNEWQAENKTFTIPDDIEVKLQNEAANSYKTQSYETPNRFVKNLDAWYDTPIQLCVLEPALTGKTYQDRLGQITY